MASKQQFDGNFNSQHSQFIGSTITGSVFLGSPNLTNEDLTWDSCVKSLAFEGSRQREGVIERNTEGTCEWIFKSPAYSRWVDGHGLLLIRGSPGCGKSTLLKFMLSRELEAAAATGSLVLSFFFYGSGTELQNGIAGLLRSLLLQLFEQDERSKESFHEVCRKRWTAEGKKDNSLIWHQNEAQAIFESLILEYSTRRKATIFIDAVDECRAEDRARLISFLHRIRGREHVRLNSPRICATCRPYPEGQINADFHIRLEEENQYDIQNFIEQELRLPDDTELAVNNLKEILRNKADGLFLWLALVIRQVHNMRDKGLNIKLIESEILKIPRELQELYEDLLKQIEDEDLLEAGKLFQWICFAGRPLSLDELRIAITVQLSGTKTRLDEYEDENNPNFIMNERKMKKRMIYLSRGLADIANPKSTAGNFIVGLYHETIREFMLTKGLQYLDDRWKKYHKLKEYHGLSKTAHFQLANTCVDYLSTKEICLAVSQRWTRLPARFYFVGYAAEYWLAHAVKAEKNRMGESVRWPSQTVIDAWVYVFEISHPNSTMCPEEGTSLMHIAAELGLERLAKSICNSTKKKDQAFPETKSKLRQTVNFRSLTARNNTAKGDGRRKNCAVTDTARINQRNLQKTYGASHGPSRLVESRAARQIKEPANFVPRFRRTDEQKLITMEGQKDKTTVINARTKKGELPLHLAARGGHLSVVRFICAHDSEVNMVNQDSCTALHMAAENGHVDVVKFLHNHGVDADIHTATKNGSTPLYSASRNGHLDVVKFLYDHGAHMDIHTATHDGWTPINVASLHGHLDVVKFLYDHGADVDIHRAINGGATPLHLASLNGHLEVVRFLYDHGADADIHRVTDDGLTPLHLASQNGHLDVVKFLYEHGADADIHRATDDGWIPLHLASLNGHLDVVKFLYDHGADVDIHTAIDDGRTSLHLASQDGHLDVVKFLYDHGAEADIHIAAKDGRRPLHEASLNGHVEVVQLLLTTGVDLFIRDHHGWTPLHAASYSGHVEVGKLLLQNGADINIGNKDGWTPLHEASCHGHIGICKLLIEQGADIRVADATGRTPLLLASQNGHAKVVKLLVEQGADINAVDNSGAAPLSIASLNKTF